MFFVIIANGCIWTRVLWCRKQLLCPMCHHCYHSFGWFSFTLQYHQSDSTLHFHTITLVPLDHPKKPKCVGFPACYFKLIFMTVSIISNDANGQQKFWQYFQQGSITGHREPNVAFPEKVIRDDTTEAVTSESDRLPKELVRRLCSTATATTSSSTSTCHIPRLDGQAERKPGVLGIPQEGVIGWSGWWRWGRSRSKTVRAFERGERPSPPPSPTASSQKASPSSPRKLIGYEESIFIGAVKL